MHLEVLIGAVAKELRAARTEVGQPGDVLPGRQSCRTVEVNFCVIVVFPHPTQLQVNNAGGSPSGKH